LFGYILSRTKYYVWGGWLVVVGVSAAAYIFILFGQSPNPVNSLNAFIPLTLILGALILNSWGTLAITVLNTLLVSLLPMFLPEIGSEPYRMAGNFFTMGVLVVISIQFRNSIERRRLTEMQRVNQDLRQANVEVERSSARVRAILGALPDGIGMTDASGVFVEANQSMARLVKHPDPTSLVGRNATDLIHPTDRPRALQDFTTGKAVGRSTEYRMAAVDGSEFDGELTFAALPDEQGHVSGYVTAVRDISLQKQAAEAFRQSEARQRQILNTIEVSILISKLPEGRVVFANQAMADTFGVSLPEFIGSDATALYEDIADRETILASLRTRGSFDDIELRVRRLDTRQPFWVSVSGRMIEFAGEQVLLASFLDITSRKQAEFELRYRSQFERLMTDISGQFVGLSGSLDDQIIVTLRAIGEFASMDRAYVFRFSDERGEMDNTHEWCAPGIPAHQHELQNVPLDTFPWMMKQLRNRQIVNIPRVADLPAEAHIERAEYEHEGIQSLLLIPMSYQDTLFGFVGFDAVREEGQWTEDRVRLLRTLADTLASALERQRVEAQIEDSMVRRGRQVQLSTQVAQDIAAAANLPDLYQRVVTQVKEQFGYYHTQVLRYNPAIDAVALEVGYGAVGEQMLARGHRMPMGMGLIGVAAATGQTVLRPNLVNDPAWQPNPLLPKTAGELAVPIKLGDNVLGVLDVQSDQPEALSEEDQVLLEGLCGQIAIAIENTRLRQEMQQRLVEMDALSRAMSTESWREYQSSMAHISGYSYDQVDLQPQTEWPPALSRAVQESRIVPSSEGQALTAMPLVARGGEAIGAIGIYEDPQNPLSTEDLAFVEQVTDQIAQALESARLFDQTQLTLAQTETLYDIGRLLNNATNVDEILDALSLPARQNGCGEALLYYFDLDSEDQPQWINIMAVWRQDGNENPQVGLSLPAGESYLLKLFPYGPIAPRFITDIASEAAIDPVFKNTLLTSGTRALTLVPIVQTGHWMGMVSFGWEQARQYSQSERDTYNALMGLAAPVVQSRRLLIQAQTRAQRERALRQITSAVRSSTDAAVIMRTAVREIGTLLGRKALIRLEQPEAQSTASEDGNASSPATTAAS